MSALRNGLVALGIAACVLVGCNTSASKKYDTKVVHEERWEKPPDDPRYNNAPESDYKKPAARDKFRSDGPPGAGGMSQGMGGQPMGGGGGRGQGFGR